MIYNQLFFPVSCAIIIILISAIFYFWKKCNPKKTLIVITGISDSGKTSLFCRLCYNKLKKTCTSRCENIGIYKVKGDGKELNIVDIPGYEKVRSTYFDKYKSKAKLLLFLIDSSVIEEKIQDISTFLYDIINDTIILSNKTPIYVILDKKESKDANFYKLKLEKQMGLIHLLKQACLQTTTGNKESSKSKSKDFDLDNIGIPLKFIQTNIKEEKMEELIDILH